MPDQMTQQQMEETLRYYSSAMPEQYPDSINAWLHPVFEACDAQAQSYTCSFDIKPAYANPMGTLHGGIIALILDTAMGQLTHVLAHRKPPTISMNVSYLRPIPTNCPVFVRARMEKLGATVGYVSAKVYTADNPDRILATATASYLVTRLDA